MESYASEALTNTGPVRILTGDAQPWRVASPQDQSLLSQLGPGSLTPLTLLGEGAYGCVELCRVSVSVPVNPLDSSPSSSCQHALSAREPRGPHAPPGEFSTASQPITDSCEDPLASLRNCTAAGVAGPGPSGSSTTAVPATANISTTAVAAADNASEAVLSPRDREVVVRPGRFSVHRLHLSPSQPHDPRPPSPCDTPLGPSHPPSYLARLQRRGCQGPVRSSAPAATLTAATALGPVCAGAVASPAGTSAAAASALWPATPSSAADAVAAAGGCGTSAVNVSGGAYGPRPCSSSSIAALSSAPPSARSAGVPLSPPSTTAAVGTPPTPSSAAGAASVLSNELVVAVKRVGFRGSATRTGVGGRGEPDGCVDCTGGAVGRGRGVGGGGGQGPSRTRLNRMQAIELLQLSRCRECPFIVRVFGCVPDDPRRAPAAAAAGVAVASPPPKQSPRAPSKLSPRRPRAASTSSSSSSTSCRIVMEWAEGGDLGSLVKALSARRGPCSEPSRERLLMSESSARYYTACLLEALGFLHGKGLIHRDVKPANLLLTSDGRAKLGDLGMVCHLDKAGQAAGRAGTPVYMAPEVWAYGTGPKFSSYGANADLWSAGVTLHEMLTGHLPASHPDEYLKRNWAFSPRHAAFSPELRDLLARLLAPRPRRRLQSCAEVASHPWFSGFDWQGLRDGTLAAPYVPAAHRPLGGSAAAAAAAGAARLRQSPRAGLVTAATEGCGVELMPPLLEENTAPAAAAAAAAAARAVAADGEMVDAAVVAFPNISTAPLRQSAPTLSGAAGSVAAVSSASTTAAGTNEQPSLICSSSGQPNGPEPPRPLSPAAMAAPGPSTVGAAAASIWRSLGWPAAAARPAPAAAVSASAPVSAAAAGASAGAARAAASSADHVSSGCGGLGVLSSALASAFAPIVSSPRAARDVLTATAEATAAAAASALRCATGAAASGGRARTASAPASDNVSATSALLLSTAASATAAMTTAAASASDCAPTHGDSRTATTTISICGGDGDGRNICGSGAAAAAAAGGENPSVAWRRNMGVGSLAASTDSQASAVAGISVPIAAHGHPAQEPLGFPWAVAPIGAVQRAVGRSAGGAVAISRVYELSQAAAQDGNGLESAVAAPARLDRSAAAPVAAAGAPASPQSALLGALASLQHHVQGIGPAGRRAGGWLQQRFADAAALAAALPDQLQSAATAAAAAVGGGRACKSDGGTGGSACGGAPGLDAAVGSGAGSIAGAAAAVLLQSSPAFLCDQGGLAGVDAADGLGAPFRAGGDVTTPTATATAAPSGAAAAAVVAGPARPYPASSSPWRSGSSGGAEVSGGGSGGGGVSSAHQEPGGRLSMSSSAMLMLLRAQLSGQSCSSDAATVTVVVRTSAGGCGGHGSGAGAGAGKAAEACGGLRRGCEAGPDGAVASACCSAGAGGCSPSLQDSRAVVNASTPAPDATPAACPASTAIITSATAATSTAPVDSASPPRKTDVSLLGTPLVTPAHRLTRAASYARHRHHRRTGSFCFDPLEQGRPMGLQHQASAGGGSPATPPSRTSSSSATRRLPGSSGRARAHAGARAHGHGRSASFSFDVGGLLSAGLLLSGSPALLAAAASSDSFASARTASSSSSPGTGVTTAATAVVAAATTTSSGGAEWPCQRTTSAPADGVGGSGLAAAAVCGRGAALWPSGPSGSCDSGAVGWPVLPQPQYHLQHHHHYRQAAEAAMLVYVACVAMLVMAWAVIRKGGAGRTGI